MTTDPDLYINLENGELHLTTEDTTRLLADEIHDPGDVLKVLRAHALVLTSDTADRLFGDYPDPQLVQHAHPARLLEQLSRREQQL
ncbi:hypothetical protein [Dietzia cercidiphylli]|uniref:hypothetical protein n=1 Tax=Dietzia cercidiphylli TaxID=498199 RepID=UPI00223C24DF|nr:hypothetical protein [Dietzia cercidiphylli]MCT1515297.1 hypothetical protein [Dietzia cercidiphylli]